MAKQRILVLGRSHMELTLTSQRLPREGETLCSDGKYGFSGGGSGLLSAVAVARMDADALLCTRVGTDIYGNRLKKLLENSGVSLRSVLTDKVRPTSLKVLLAPGDQTPSALLYDGAASHWNDEDIEEAFVAYPDALLLCGDLAFEQLKSGAFFAAEDDIPTVLNVPFCREELPLHELGRLRAAVLGEREIYSYTGTVPDSVSEYVKAAIKLSSRIPADYYVFRMDKRGTYVTDGKYSELIAPIPVDVVDRRGVSETFAGVLTASYAVHKDMKTAAIYAQAATVLCSAKAGAVGSIPDRAAVEELLERLG